MICNAYFYLQKKRITRILKDSFYKFLIKIIRVVCTLFVLVHWTLQLFFWKFLSVAVDNSKEHFEEYSGIMASSKNGADPINSTDSIWVEVAFSQARDGLVGKRTKTLQLLNFKSLIIKQFLLKKDRKSWECNTRPKTLQRSMWICVTLISSFHVRCGNTIIIFLEWNQMRIFQSPLCIVCWKCGSFYIQQSLLMANIVHQDKKWQNRVLAKR